jgi:hypothetical protein
MNRIKAIKTFFEMDGGRTVAMEELKKLNPVERHEIASLCAAALGVELTETAPVPVVAA